MQQEYTIWIELSLNGRVVEKHMYIERYKRAYIYANVDNTLDSGIVQTLDNNISVISTMPTKCRYFT